MTRSDMMSVLLGLARDVLDADDLEFEESTPFEELEGWDSTSHLHMVLAVERAFRISFSNADLQRVVRVGDLVDWIANRMPRPRESAS